MRYTTKQVSEMTGITVRRILVLRGRHRLGKRWRNHGVRFTEKEIEQLTEIDARPTNHNNNSEARLDTRLKKGYKPEQPTEPTLSICGSRAKIEEMAERYRRGEELHHPDDGVFRADARYAPSDYGRQTSEPMAEG
jgi:hypothetical protein